MQIWRAERVERSLKSEVRLFAIVLFVARLLDFEREHGRIDLRRNLVLLTVVITFLGGSNSENFEILLWRINRWLR